MTASGLRALLVGATVGVAACAPSTDPKSPPQPAHDAPARSQPTLPESVWGVVTSPRFAFEVSLPDPGSWNVDDQATRWFVATHAPTSSEVALRAWRAERLATATRCEAQARSWRKSLPPNDPEAVVDEIDAEVPRGYRTRITVGVRPTPWEPRVIEGYVLAFGATVQRCVAFAFTTTASGPGAEEAVGRRLGVAAGGIVTTLRPRGVLDRAPSREESP